MAKTNIFNIALAAVGIYILYQMVKTPGIAGQFATDVFSVPGHISTYARTASGAASESFGN